MNQKAKKKSKKSLPVIKQMTSANDPKTQEVIQRIAKEHSHRPFGYLTQEDMEGEIWFICLKALPDYNPDSGNPLENFLRVTVKNRLTNRFKDVTKSVKSPCPSCPYYDPNSKPNCLQFGEERERCSKWRDYKLTIESRNSLLNAVEPTFERCGKNDVDVDLQCKEVIEIIEAELDESFSKDFSELVTGGKLSKQRHKRLIKEIRRILQEHDYA